MDLPSRRGFTLVELLVASLVAVVVAAGFYESMQASSRRYQAGESGLEATHETQRILEYLRRDLEGPWPWSPCEYPEKVLKELGYAGSAVDFAVEYRQLDHWFTYYRREGTHGTSGPIQASTQHTAQPARVLAPTAPCKVVWSHACPGKPRWITQPPSIEDLICLKTTEPWLEYVPLDRPHTRGIWILGPAFWSFDPTRKMLIRWTAEGGFHEFGAGRLERFEIQPVQEWSVLKPDPPVNDWVPIQVKQMMRVELAMGRDAGRPDLELVTLVTRLSPQTP